MSFGKTILMERSLFTDRYVFAKMLYHDDKIEDIEYQIYIKWFEHFMNDIPEIEFIYLDIPAETCLERIRQRNRKGEESITLEYLTMCEEYHRSWLTGNCLHIKYQDITFIKNWLR